MAEQGQPVRPSVGPLPPKDAYQMPSRIEQVPGTPFGLVYLKVPAGTSGPAVGSLATGISSICVVVVMACFGFAGASHGWGAWLAGAFAVLATALGLAGVGLGLVGMRQIRRARAAGPAAEMGGRGLAVSGVTTGATGVSLTVLVLATVLLIQFG